MGFIERGVLYIGDKSSPWHSSSLIGRPRCGDWVSTLRVNTWLQSEPHCPDPRLWGQVGAKFTNIIYTGIKTVMYDKPPLRPSLVKTVAGVLQTEQILCPMIQWPGQGRGMMCDTGHPESPEWQTFTIFTTQGNFLLSSHNSQPQLGGC